MALSLAVFRLCCGYHMSVDGNGHTCRSSCRVNIVVHFSEACHGGITTGLISLLVACCYNTLYRTLMRLYIAKMCSVL